MEASRTNTVVHMLREGESCFFGTFKLASAQLSPKSGRDEGQKKGGDAPCEFA